MWSFLFATLALANLVTVSCSFGALDLFSVLLPVFAARSCGCFFLGCGLLVSLVLAAIRFSGADLQVEYAVPSPRPLWVELGLVFGAIVIGSTGIPLFLSENLVSISLASQLFLFDLGVPLSRTTLFRQAGLLLSPVFTVLLTIFFDHLLNLYLQPKMDSLADVLLSLRPVVPSLFIMGTLFFLASWFPVVFSNPLLLVLSMLLLYAVAFLITKYLIGPRIKQIVFSKFPQCMSEYMEEGNDVDASMSCIERTRILEVLSVSQAGFAFVTFPGYAAMAVVFIHRLCHILQLDASWSVPVGVIVTGISVILSLHRLYKMISEKVSVDAIQGLACQIAILLTCLCGTLAGVEVNFAAISLASVFSLEYFKKKQSTKSIFMLMSHSLLPAILSVLIKIAVHLTK